MQELLLGVDSSDHVANGFYPLLLQHAGEEHTLASFAQLFIRAMREYTDVETAWWAILLRVEEYAHTLFTDPNIAEEASKKILRSWS